MKKLTHNQSVMYKNIVMKNLSFLLTILFILIFTGIKAQSPWTRLSASPQENTLNCIQKIPGTSKLIAVGEGSTVMISEDIGENWQLILNPAGRGNGYICKGVCFINETTGFINGGKETILKTIDGGLTWELKYFGNAFYEWESINEIEFVNELTGFAVGGEGQLFRTTDGGESWPIMPSGVAFDLTQIEFADSLTGFITDAFDSLLLKTSDGGNVWTVINYPTGLPNLHINDIHFISDSIGFISGTSDETVLLRTTDQGITWTQVYSSWLQSDGGKFVFFNELSGFYALPTVVQYSSVIISTDDGGNTWTESWTSNLSWLDTYSLCAFDQNTVFSVGAYGALSKSSDGGMNWTPMGNKIFLGDIYDVQFLNQNEGFALSHVLGGGVAQSELKKTNDGGLSWNRIDKFYFYRGASNFLNSDTGFVASKLMGTTINKTTDGGNTWTEIGTGFDFEPTVIKFYDFNNGLIAGDGKMIKTNDGGNTWHAVALESIYDYDFNDIEYRSANKVFAVGRIWTQSAILKSNDGGDTWEKVIIDNFVAANDIFFIDDNTAFLGTFNSILKSTDGGDTWTPTTTYNPNPIDFRSIHFPTHDLGYAVGDGAIENMVKTTDGGNTWYPILTNVTSGLNSVYFSDSESGLVFGEGGVLLKTTTGGITAVQESYLIPDKNFFEVYPNPISEVVNILFNPDIEHNGAEIVITDCVGKKLKIIQAKNSTTPLQFSMNHYSPGIYLFQYVSRKGVLESKKVIVR